MAITYTPGPWDTLREKQLTDLLNAYTTTIAPGPWAAPRPTRIREKTAPTIDIAFNPDAAYPIAGRTQPHG